MQNRRKARPSAPPSSRTTPFETYEDPASLQQETAAMPSRPGKLARSLSRPFADIKNRLRVSMHQERGIDSKTAAFLSEQRRRSGGVGPSTFDEVAHGDALRAPVSSTSRSPLDTSDETPRSSAGGLSTPLSSLLPSPASLASTLPTEEAFEVISLPCTPPRPSFDLPPTSGTLTEGQPRWKGKERAKHPVLVETCPTPPSTAKYRPGSRQRSIMHPSGLGIDVDDFTYGDDEEEEEQEVLEDEDPDEWNAYSRRPSATFTVPVHSPSSSSALPFPSDVVESLLSRPSSSASSMASPPISPRHSRSYYYGGRDRNFTPPLQHLRPLRQSEILEPPQSSPHQRELRAKVSESSLYTWDLAHLPAPRTPREKPFRVGLKDLLLPSFALGGGKGSGKFADPFGPVERQMPIERPPTPSNGLARTLSRRSARVRRSLGAWSLRSTREEPRQEEIDEGWTTLVLQ